jgi:hypothetical protein
VIATIIPINTNTTIAICIQIQVGDIARDSLLRAVARVPAETGPLATIVLAMDRRVPKAAVGLALALCTLAWVAAAGNARQGKSASVSAALLGGVNVAAVSSGTRPASTDGEIALARALHSKVVRVEVPWSELEPLAPNQIDQRALAVTDRLVSDAAAAGIKVIALVWRSPCWASSAPASILRRCVPGRLDRANGWPPRVPADYAAFVAYLARRYGTRLAAIEIWNEPDQANEDYFAGPSKPQRYAAILRAAYPAIKQANPNVPVLAGSLVGSKGAFLRALYAAGIKGYYDGLAVHFYNLTLASLRSIHEVQLANGDAKPLWLDEFGWSSCWPRQKIQQEQACVTTQTQAANIANTYRALSRTTYVAAAVLYKLRDSRAEEFGVLSTNWAHKSSFSPFAHVLASPFASVSPVTLSLRTRGRAVVAGGSGPVGDFMQLEAFQNGLLRYRALFTLNRFNRYSIVLPAVLGTHGLRVRVFRYWTGSARNAQKSI